jgi:hypothetical protein
MRAVNIMPWSPVLVPRAFIGQNVSMAPAALPPAPPFIDSAFMSLVFDGLIVAGAGIAAFGHLQDAKKSTDPKKKSGLKNWSYAFFGLSGLFAMKGIVDINRLTPS